jgi:hypothetical protein
VGAQQQKPGGYGMGRQHHHQDVVQLSQYICFGHRGKGRDWKEGNASEGSACPAQTKDYCKMFHLIDKGNGNEAKYDMARKSQSHNWAPKLAFCLFNMAMNNAYVVYKELVGRESGKSLSMGKAVKELVHSFCQQGASL